MVQRIKRKIFSMPRKLQHLWRKLMEGCRWVDTFLEKDSLHTPPNHMVMKWLIAVALILFGASQLRTAIQERSDLLLVVGGSSLILGVRIAWYRLRSSDTEARS